MTLLYVYLMQGSQSKSTLLEFAAQFLSTEPLELNMAEKDIKNYHGAESDKINKKCGK